MRVITSYPNYMDLLINTCNFEDYLDLQGTLKLLFDRDQSFISSFQATNTELKQLISHDVLEWVGSSDHEVEKIKNIIQGWDDFVTDAKTLTDLVIITKQNDVSNETNKLHHYAFQEMTFNEVADIKNKLLSALKSELSHTNIDFNQFVSRNSSQLAEKNQELNAWSTALQTHTIAGYQQFINSYPNSDSVSIAKSHINKIQQDLESEEEARKQKQEATDWNTALTQNTIEGYERFLNKYPSSDNRETANSRIEQLKHNKAKAEALKAEELTREKARQAEEQARLEKEQAILTEKNREQTAWNKALEKCTIESFETFLQAYPKSDFAVQADENLRKLREKQNSDTEKSAFEKAISINTIESYLAFKAKYPNSENLFVVDKKIQAIKTKQEEEAWEKAKLENTVSAYKAYIKTYPKGLYFDYAKQKLAILNDGGNELKLPIGTKKIKYCEPCSLEYKLTRTRCMKCGKALTEKVVDIYS